MSDLGHNRVDDVTLNFNIGELLMLKPDLKPELFKIKPVEFDPRARKILDKVERPIRIIAHRPVNRTLSDKSLEWHLKKKASRLTNYMSFDTTQSVVLFLEVLPARSSVTKFIVTGRQLNNYAVLQTSAKTTPNAVASILLAIRNTTYTIPHLYFEWCNTNSLWTQFWSYFGRDNGDTPLLTQLLLKKTETDPERRPGIHVLGY